MSVGKRAEAKGFKRIFPQQPTTLPAETGKTCFLSASLEGNPLNKQALMTLQIPRVTPLKSILGDAKATWHETSHLAGSPELKHSHCHLEMWHMSHSRMLPHHEGRFIRSQNLLLLRDKYRVPQFHFLPPTAGKVIPQVEILGDTFPNPILPEPTPAPRHPDALAHPPKNRTPTPTRTDTDTNTETNTNKNNNKKHAHTNKHTHTNAKTQIHKQTQTHTHTGTNTDTQALTGTQTQTQTQTQTHSHTNTSTQTQEHTQASKQASKQASNQSINQCINESMNQ